MRKEIPGFTGYAVDEATNVYSFRTKSGKISNFGTQLKKFLWGEKENKYWAVTLHLNGKKVKRKVAVIMLETFVSPRPNGMVACHGTKGRYVDTLDNLSWKTQTENMADKKRDGTEQVGENNPYSKLNNFQVRIIRRLWEMGKDCGVTQPYIASIFNISLHVVHRIIRRKSWKHI